MKMKSYRGVTLLELMFVVAILGIVVAIIIPSYRMYVRYGDTNRCASYVMGSRFNAIDWMIAGGSVADINADVLKLSNSNLECSKGVAIDSTEASLSIRGLDSNRVYIMSLNAGNGAWSCSITNIEGDVLSSGSCANLGD